MNLCHILVTCIYLYESCLVTIMGSSAILAAMEKKVFGFQTRSDTYKPTCTISEKAEKLEILNTRRRGILLSEKRKQRCCSVRYPTMQKAIFLLTWLIYRQSDNSLTRLPQQHVDTGMGLDRMCVLLQGTMSNYNRCALLRLFTLPFISQDMFTDSEIGVSQDCPNNMLLVWG